METRPALPFSDWLGGLNSVREEGHADFFKPYSIQVYTQTNTLEFVHGLAQFFSLHEISS